jgi:diketogulonate reductase-like aldo/keto reductase
MEDAAGVALLAAAQSAGCRHFDTAEVYQQFKGVLPGTQKFNEALIGLFVPTVYLGRASRSPQSSSPGCMRVSAIPRR